jgi:uncharacterized membrane protein
LTLTLASGWAYQCLRSAAWEGNLNGNGRHGDAARELSAAELGVLAHLYRGEVYRSTIWRTRLDTTANWAVVTLGVALSLAFASPDASCPG